MRICAVLLAVSAASVLAQESTPQIRRAIPANPVVTPAPTPEIRRAEPVNPDTYQNPDWINRVPRATAVNPQPTPSATPGPISKSLPLEPKDTPTPAITAETPSPSPTASFGEPAPQLESEPAGNRSLLAANGFYRRKMYDMAVYDYEKFLITEPNAKGRDGALFRLGESHRFLGNSQAARDAYQRLLAEFTEGEFVGSGAYRLGEILYTEGSSGPALAMFEKAEVNTKEPAVKLSALYYQASALDKLGRRSQAAKKFAQITHIEGDNPYRSTAEFYLAEDAARTGRKQDAFTAYEKLSENADSAQMKAEATVKAAALAAEMARNDRARDLFKKALTLPAIGDWRGVAKLGVLRLSYEEGDYKAAAELSSQDLRDLPADSVAEALLISANARRQLGEAPKALELYDQIMREYPRSEAAGQAHFQRLVCLEATGAPDLSKQLDEFLAVSTDPRERAQATLLKAEVVFKAGDHAAAAPLYAQVLKSGLPARLRHQARYKLGWCQLQRQQYMDAAQTFTIYIDQNPKSELLPAALAQRAMALQQGKAYDDALRDFERLLTEFPKAREREIALQQKALILGQQEKYDAMSAVFAQLLKEYPKSKAAAQAEFWLGWAAFQKKEYPASIEHLKKARELDGKSFGERATQRIIFAYYVQEDRDAVAKEIPNIKLELLSADILMWLGSKYYEDGNYRKAEEFLAPIAERASGATNPDVLLELAKARLAQKKFEPAREPIRQYLSLARDPVSRARGLLASAEVSLGTGNYEDANKLIEEALLLQPEGQYNAEGRLLAGEVLVQRGDYDGAARGFMTIAVLYDDPEITPKALERAAAAYLKAGNSAEAQKALAERDQRYPEGASKKQGAKAQSKK